MFKRVELGRYGRRLKDVLTGQDTSWMNHVDCAFVHFRPPRYDKGLWQPFPNKYGEVKVFQFYLYPWKLLIKLDRRSFGPVWQGIALKGRSSTFALVMNDFSIGEQRLLMNLQRKIKLHHAARENSS